MSTIHQPSRLKPAPRADVMKGTAAMSFEEIAVAMGYGRSERGTKAVFMLYFSAMRKIRRRLAAIKRLEELVQLQAQTRRDRCL